MNKNLKNIVIDTSSLMDNSIVLDQLVDTYNIILSIVTIEELDNLKTNKDLKKAFKAKHAIRHIEKYKKCIQFSLSREIDNSFNQNQYNLNDDIIVTCAKNNNAYLITDDLNLKIKANAIGVTCIEKNIENILYKGFKRVKLSDEETAYFYEHLNQNQFDSLINEYIIITNNTEDFNDAYRWDGSEYTKLRLPSSKILKGKNILQSCAIDMLMNKDIDIVALLGGYGSGKTFLSLRMALYAVKEKETQTQILGVREMIGEGKEIGFLPGEFADKTGKFFTPLEQSLDGKEYELKSLTDNGKLNFNIPYYLKGTTYDNTVIVCDEAEDFSEKQIKLVGTRLGKNSRIFFSGDYKQGIFNATETNPLVKMCNEFKGNPKFACIFMEDDVRSEASKMFANLFE